MTRSIQKMLATGLITITLATSACAPSNVADRDIVTTGDTYFTCVTAVYVEVTPVSNDRLDDYAIAKNACAKVEANFMAALKSSYGPKAEEKFLELDIAHYRQLAAMS